VAGHRALIVSVLAHGALLVAVTRWFDGGHGDDRAARGRDAEPIAIEILPPPPAPPMEVALLDGDARSAPEPAMTAVAVSRGGGRGRAIGAAAAPEVGTGTGTVPGPTGIEPPGRANPLAMRGLRHDLTPSDEVLDRALQDRPLPEAVKPTGLIEPKGREGRITDKVATFVVHGDGTVSIKNKKDIDLHWMIHLPTPSRILGVVREEGEDLAAWAADPYRDREVGTTQDLPRHLQATSDACQSYADPMCDATPPKKITRSLSGDGAIIPVFGGGFDVTSYLHRKYVGDPYAARKLKILDSTRDERAARGAEFRAAQLGQSAELMSKNLDALWRTTTDPAARREALFQLWDECVEGEGPAGVAGARARAMVVGWIGTHLPRDQPGAFSTDDIARFDAKRSSAQHFAPY
jgi:hypothetical protein